MIVKYIVQVIDLCNNNAGFISAILAVISIVISIKLARLPYLKKLSFNNYLDKTSKDDIMLVVYIANIGNCPIYVDEIEVKEGNKTTIYRDAFNSYRFIIKPQECREYRIVLKGYKSDKTDEYKPLKIELKAGKKTFKYKTDWAMG